MARSAGPVIRWLLSHGQREGPTLVLDILTLSETTSILFCLTYVFDGCVSTIMAGAKTVFLPKKEREPDVPYELCRHLECSRRLDLCDHPVIPVTFYSMFILAPIMTLFPICPPYCHVPRAPSSTPSSLPC